MLARDIDLKTWGNSQGFRILKDDLVELGVKENETGFRLVVEDGKMTITPRHKYPQTLDELFEGYEDDYLPTEFDWGDPVGREIW